MANLYRRKQSGKSTHKRNVEPSNVDDKDKALHTPGSKSAAIETALRKQDEDESARWKRARELQDNIIATILVWVPMLGLIFGGCCSNVCLNLSCVLDPYLINSNTGFCLGSYCQVSP